MQQQVLNLLMGSAGALVLSAAARALPEPPAPRSSFYGWFYQFAHLLLANFDKAQIGNDIQSSSH
jgi:hypothetical protein